MKHLIIIGLITLLCILFVSCNQILVMRYGIRQPREETPETILKFMGKMDYLNENIFIFKDSSAFYACMRDSIFLGNLLGTLFFSPQGVLAGYTDTLKCQWPGESFVQNLHSNTLPQANTGYTLQNLITSMVPLNDATRIDTANARYIVVVTWATFLGNYNERLFSIRDVIRQNAELEVKPVFLCIDVQKEWNLTNREKNALRFE